MEAEGYRSQISLSPIYSPVTNAEIDAMEADPEPTSDASPASEEDESTSKFASASASASQAAAESTSSQHEFNLDFIKDGFLQVRGSDGQAILNSNENSDRKK
jgi:hypothetical protein